MSARIAAFLSTFLISSCAQTVESPAPAPETPAPPPTAVAVAAASPEPPPCDGKMCYEIVGSKIIIYNTPGEQDRMESETDIPPDIASVKRQLMIYDKVDSKKLLGSIDILIDRKGLKSVSMKGKPVPKKE